MGSTSKYKLFIFLKLILLFKYLLFSFFLVRIYKTLKNLNFIDN